MVAQAHTYSPRVPKLTRLREVREDRFLTQVELAKAAGVSEATVVRIEKQQIEARFSTIRALAQALGVQPKELL